MSKRHFGNARELPSGRWQVRYRGPDGKLRPAPNTFKDKRSAQRWLSLKEAEIARGEWIDPDAGKVTVEEWGRRWLASVEPSLKPKTRELYGSLLRTLVVPRFGSTDVGDVRPIMVSEWVASMSERGLGPSRIRQGYRVLSLMMAAAVINEMVKTSPCRGVRLPRLPQTEPHVMTVEEVERLIAAAPHPHDLMIQILAYAGLRIGEALALRRSCIDPDTGYLLVAETVTEVKGKLVFGTPKSHQQRKIKIPGFLVDALRRHLDQMTDKDPSALLFVGRTGNAFRYGSWRKWQFDPAVKRAGLEDVTPHDLRASHASWVAERHGVMAAARRLGHSNASVTTRHYARAVEGRDEQIADTFDENRTTGKAATTAGGTDREADHVAREWHGDDDDPPAGVPVTV
jgi:integrase